MNFIEIMIGNKLNDANPSLDAMGSDRKVLQFACQDFVNYLKFHWNLIGKETSRLELIERLEKQLLEEPDDLEAFLTIWVAMWLKKWKERVKVLIGDQKQSGLEFSKKINKVNPYWKKVEHKQELVEVVVGTLLKKGEICGTEILAENLLKDEFRERRVQKVNDRKYVFSVMNSTLHKAREISRSKGPLIFVNIEKEYYCLIR
jgi:hypothetical protein